MFKIKPNSALTTEFLQFLNKIKNNNMANHKEATLPRNKLVHDKCRPCVLPLYCKQKFSNYVLFFYDYERREH